MYLDICLCHHKYFFIHTCIDTFMRDFIYVLYAAQKLHDLCIKVYIDPIDHNMLGPR